MRAAAALTLLLALTALPAAAQESSWTSFRFEAYNREYVNVRSNSEWQQGGPLALTVSSPSHRLVIRDHEVGLRPSGGGEFDTRVRVSFSGEGDLSADLGLVGAGTRLEDHVVAPLQEVEVAARVRFSQVEGGYEIVTVELPAAVTVQIESRMGNQLVEVCKKTLAVLGVGCSGLDSIFSSVPVPLPAAGGTYYISEDQLGRTERRRLNRFLQKNGQGLDR